jgi:hypothetical protein
VAVKFAQKFGAVATVKRLAEPGLKPAARAIAEAIPAYVPVERGVVKRTYKPVVREQPDSIRVHVGSPFWHWLEYGTRWNAAYRVVERAVRSLGLRWQAKGVS